MKIMENNSQKCLVDNKESTTFAPANQGAGFGNQKHLMVCCSGCFQWKSSSKNYLKKLWKRFGRLKNSIYLCTRKNDKGTPLESHENALLKIQDDKRAKACSLWKNINKFFKKFCHVKTKQYLCSPFRFFFIEEPCERRMRCFRG